MEKLIRITHRMNPIFNTKFPNHVALREARIFSRIISKIINILRQFLLYVVLHALLLKFLKNNKRKQGITYRYFSCNRVKSYMYYSQKSEQISENFQREGEEEIRRWRKRERMKQLESIGTNTVKSRATKQSAWTLGKNRREMTTQRE